MKKMLVAGGTLLLGFLPLAALAAPIVSNDLVKKGPYLQLCDLLTLANSLIQYGIYLAIIVATIMFVYAGILYVTAPAAQGTANIDKAKKVFWTVFWGLVIVLAAWLVVDIILSVLTPNGGLKFWSKIDCVDYAITQNASTGQSIVTVTTTPSGGPILSDDDARAQLKAAGIDVNKENCSSPGQTDCTSLEGIPASTVQQLIAMKQQCGSSCTILVTGGTEAGHKTHGVGEPIVDIRFDQATADYIAANRAALGISQVCTDASHAQYSYGCGSYQETQPQLHLKFGP